MKIDTRTLVINKNPCSFVKNMSDIKVRTTTALQTTESIGNLKRMNIRVAIDNGKYNQVTGEIYA